MALGTHVEADLDRLRRARGAPEVRSEAEFGANLGPTWVHFGTKNASKNDQKTIQKSLNFCMALGTHLEPDLGRF